MAGTLSLACLQQLAGAAGDAGRRHGFHAEEVGPGRGQADEIARKQERKHLATSVGAGPAHPQDAGHDIEYLVGWLTGTDHHLAGYQFAQRRGIKDVQEDVLGEIEGR